MTSESEPDSVPGNSIEIDAPPARVWEIVCEVRNAPLWSAQASKVFAAGGPTGIGTRALNINKQGPVYWPTTSKVVAFDPGRRVSNRIGGHRTVWGFDLEPTPSGGTRLTQRHEIPAALVSVAGFLGDKLPGGRSEDARPRRRGPSTSLRRIKTLAEQN